MSQVSYGTITITDTNDIESIYMIYKGGDNNETPPSITWTGGQVDWTTDITTVEGDYIWAITVYKKSGIAITADNYQEFFGDPVCLTGSSGRSVRSINTYYCNYGEGRPDETYNGWSGAVPEYDENKPNYWVKTVITYVDSTEEVIEASGAIASFNTEDKETSFRSLIADIEPIQDLHGYDKPWSGGAGANIIDADNPLTFTTTKAIVFATPIPSGTTVYAYSSSHIYATEPSSGSKVIAMRFEDANNQVVGITYANSTGIDRVTLTGDAVRVLLYSNGYNYTDSVGVTVTVNDLMVSKSPITSYAPYSNICPISGHTECVTEVCGVNVWDEEWEEGTINTNGDNSSSTTRWRTKNYISIKPNTQYYFKGTKTGSGTAVIRPRFYDADKVYIGNTSQGGTDIVANAVFTTPTNAYYMRFTPDISGTYGISTDEVSVNYPSTDHDYHAHQGTSYTTTLGRTVYGGTLDVVSGELTVDRAYISVTDMPTNRWNKLSSGSGAFYMARVFAFPDMKYPYEAVNPSYPISDTYVYSPSGTQPHGAFRVSDALYIVDDRYSTIVEFRDAYAQNPFSFVYELASPQTIQLTPQEVHALLGDNNVWADSGEVSVSVFTTAGQEITIYKDNALTKAIHDSIEANAKATEALTKAAAAQQQVTQIDTLLGGHFSFGEALSTKTPSGARIVEQLNDSPTQWFHNVNIGANGIQLRYNEAVMAQLAATNSDSSDNIALKFYQPPTINGNTTAQGNLTMALKGNALTFYDPTVANGQSVQATLDANGLKLLKGGIEAGNYSTSPNKFIYLSTEDYSGSPTITINGNNSGWRQIIGTKFGVKNDGTLYASNVVISGTMTIGANSTIDGTSASDVVNNASTGAGAASDLATYKTTVSSTYATQAALTTGLGSKASVSAEYSVDIVTSNFDPTATGTDTFITLTAKVSRVDGTAVGTISYAWYGDNSSTAISGATNASYNVPANLVWNGTTGYKTFTVQIN